MSQTYSFRGKVCLLAGIALLVVTACLIPATARAQDVIWNVNCDPSQPADYHSIQQALDSFDWKSRLELVVTGTCYERISIGDGVFAYNSVYIHAPEGQRATITQVGTAEQGTGFIVFIGGAHGIFLERLDISGGRNGVTVFDASEVDFVDVTIESNAFNGVIAQGNSSVYFASSRIRNNGTVGINITPQGASTVYFAGGPTPDFPPTVIEGNGQLGVNAGPLGTVWLNGANIVRNNGGATTAATHGGIHVARTSAVQIQSSVNGSTEIANNVGPGILAEVNSSVSLLGANIHDNSEQGVYARTQSVVELIGQDTFIANGIANIFCDAWSLLTGDTTGITAISCKNIDVPLKK